MANVQGMKISLRIKQRVLNVASMALKSRMTIREIAKELGVSKSTIHKDLTVTLKVVDPELYKKVRDILDYHISIRHLRGGEATKILHKKMKVKVG